MISFHPTGVVVEIVGTNASDRGRHCEEHECCGREVLQEDVVVRLRKVQIVVDNKEETAMEVVWVTDGCDRCRVGFLQRHMVIHAAIYDGALAQITSVFSADKNNSNSQERRQFYKMKGCCMATIISMHGMGHKVDDNDNNHDNTSGDSDFSEEERLETQPPVTPKKRTLDEI